MDRHGAQSGKLTVTNKGIRPRSVEGGVFGRTAGPDEGVFAGEALARALALTMIAGAAAPGFSPLLGSAFDGLFGWRVTFLVVAAFGVVVRAQQRVSFSWPSPLKIRLHPTSIWTI